MLFLKSPLSTYSNEASVTQRRAKFIQNKPRVNEDPKDALIREFQDEIEQLKAKLAAKQRAKTAGGGIEGLAELREQIRSKLEAGLRSGASADALQHVRHKYHK